jgi:hypothetical protein
MPLSCRAAGRGWLSTAEIVTERGADLKTRSPLVPLTASRTPAGRSGPERPGSRLRAGTSVEEVTPAGGHHRQAELVADLD